MAARSEGRVRTYRVAGPIANYGSVISMLRDGVYRNPRKTTFSGDFRFKSIVYSVHGIYIRSSTPVMIAVSRGSA